MVVYTSDGYAVGGRNAYECNDGGQNVDGLRRFVATIGAANMCKHAQTCLVPPTRNAHRGWNAFMFECMQGGLRFGDPSPLHIRAASTSIFSDMGMCLNETCQPKISQN